MSIAKLRIAASKLALGLPIESDDRPTSNELDQLGAVAPALRALTELRSQDDASFRESLLEALREQGIRLPQPREAVILLSTQVALAILDGRMTPIDGAEAIWRFSIHFDDDYPELSTFKFAALEHEDRPDEKRMFEDGIREAARELVDASS